MPLLRHARKAKRPEVILFPAPKDFYARAAVLPRGRLLLFALFAKKAESPAEKRMGPSGAGAYFAR